MPNDLGSGEELVSPAMIPITVRVHHSMGGCAPHPRVLLDHLAGMWQIPKSIHNDTAAVIDQPRIALAQSRILLQAGVDPSADLTKFHMNL